MRSEGESESESESESEPRRIGTRARINPTRNFIYVVAERAKRCGVRVRVRARASPEGSGHERGSTQLVTLFMLLRRGRDYLDFRLRWSSLLHIRQLTDSSLLSFTLLRRGRDYLDFRLRWSSLRYGTNPAASHPYSPSPCCGEGGIRTRDTLLAYTHFPGVLLQPLGHLSLH